MNEKKLKELEDQLDDIKQQIQAIREAEENKNEKYYIGKLYRKFGTKHFYAIIDYNGTIRVLNITLSIYWKGAVKSSQYSDRKNGNFKVEYLTYYEFAELLQNTGNKPHHFQLVDIQSSTTEGFAQ